MLGASLSRLSVSCLLWNVKKGGSAAHQGLAFCDALFKIERDLHDVTSEERFAGRQERSKPLLEQFHAWLDMMSERTLPKSALGSAITYCRKQWRKLLGFLLDGRLELDNNRSERSIKPFVIGRKTGSSPMHSVGLAPAPSYIASLRLLRKMDSTHSDI